VTKTKKIFELAESSRIFKNSNPVEGNLTPWYNVPTTDSKASDYDFDIKTVEYPFTKKTTDTAIYLYYRGGQYKVPVDVYGKLMGVTVTPKEGTEVRFWPDPKWDNDVDNGKGGPAALAKKLTVMATYQAVNDANVQKDTELEYWHINEPPRYKAGPYYLFATDQDTDDETDTTGDSTYKKGYDKYKAALAKGKTEVTTNVTVRHEMDSYEIGMLYGYKITAPSVPPLPSEYKDANGIWWQLLLPDGVTEFNSGAESRDPEIYGPKAQQSKKGKIAVTWVNKY